MPSARRRVPAPAPHAPDQPTTLTTERLLLRPPAPDDAEQLHRLVNDWAVVRMLSRLPFPYPRTLTDEWIASTAEQRANGTAHHLVIAGQEDGKRVGDRLRRPAAGQDARRGQPRLLGRPALLGPRRGDRGGGPRGALGAGQPADRPDRGACRRGQPGLVRRAAPRRPARGRPWAGGVPRPRRRPPGDPVRGDAGGPVRRRRDPRRHA